MIDETEFQALELSMKDIQKEIEKVKTLDDLVLVTIVETSLLPLRFLYHDLKLKNENSKKILKISSNGYNNKIVDYKISTEKKIRCKS